MNLSGHLKAHFYAVNGLNLGVHNVWGNAVLRNDIEITNIVSGRGIHFAHTVLVHMVVDATLL